MGNQCAQCDCSSEKQGGEARFDLDSEHVASYPTVKQEQTLPDYPRIGLKPQQDQLHHGASQEEGTQKQIPEDLADESGEGPPAEQQEVTAQQREMLLLRQQLEAASVALPLHTPPKLGLPQPSVNQGPLGTTATLAAVPEDTVFLEMVFEADGQDNTVRLFRRPLGAEFEKKRNSPTKIAKVKANSYASELGVKRGWIVKYVGYEDVTQMTFQDAQDTITKALATLPTQTSN
jgi:hypothetical protein